MIKVLRDVNIYDEFMEGPAKAEIEITEELAARILQLNKAVKKLKVLKICEFNNSLDFCDVDYDSEEESLKESEHRVECVALNVTDNSFYWSGLIRNTNVRWETDTILVEMLEEIVRVKKALLKDLPLLINYTEYDEVKEFIKKRMKGSGD